MKTYQPKHKDIKREWHFIDAKGAILGRMSTQIAIYLMGKHKPDYSAHMDMGDFVVVVNAKDVELTGKKKSQKVYYGHSGYPGGFKEVSFEKMINEHPEKVIQLAVKRMLPKNRLNSKRMVRLKIYPDAKHPYEERFKDAKKI